MSKEYDLVCLSFCGAVQPGVRNLLLEDNAMFIEKYFPWFKRIESASGNKALHPGVEFLIDDSPHYFTTGKHGGILFTSWPTTRIREGIVYASNWLDIAKIMEII
jgi:5'(3')-deoxyribonucleotidase